MKNSKKALKHCLHTGLSISFSFPSSFASYAKYFQTRLLPFSFSTKAGWSGPCYGSGVVSLGNSSVRRVCDVTYVYGREGQKNVNACMCGLATGAEKES